MTITTSYKKSSKFYSGTQTLPRLRRLLIALEGGMSQSEFAQREGIDKPSVTYLVKKAKDAGLVEEIDRSSTKTYEVTPKGRKFLDTYDRAGKFQPIQSPALGLEHQSFKAEVIKKPREIPALWKKNDKIRNWVQYVGRHEVTFGGQVYSATVQFNDSKHNPSIVLLAPPAAIDDHNWRRLYQQAFQHVWIVAVDLCTRLDMIIGELEPTNSAEWVVYRDPVAKVVSRGMGQVTLKGVGKVNASAPNRFGELEFTDLSGFINYMEMSARVERIEQGVERIEQVLEKLGLSDLDIDLDIKNPATDTEASSA